MERGKETRLFMRVSRTPLVFAFLFLSSAVAAAEHGAKPDSAPAAGSEGFYVQLRPVMAPVYSTRDGKQIGSAPITAVFEVEDNDRVNEVCEYAPRIIDSMMQVFYEKPVTMDSRRQFDFAGLADLIREGANRSLERETVLGVQLFNGARPINAGVLDKLPFTSARGCRGGQPKQEGGETGGGSGGGGH